MSISEGALAGLLVVDLTSGVAGGYAGKLLADFGAEVVLVEPPDGSPLRSRPPCREATSAWFAHLGGGKASVVPRDADHAQTVLRDLCAAADAVLVDGTSPWQLPSPRPAHLIEVQLSPFGRTGPYAGWHGSDLATWALGGYLHFCGDPEREPVWLPGSQGALHAGAHAAFALLAAVHERRRSGWGQAVEVSEIESVLVAHAWLASSWAACGQVLGRVPCDLIKASDGWFYMMRIAPNDAIFTLIDRPDLAAENLTADVVSWFAAIPRVFEAVEAWAAERTVAEIVEAGQAMRIAVTPVLDAAGVDLDAQLAARDWWEPDEASGLRLPGQPYQLSASPARRRGAAPLLGADTGAARTPQAVPAGLPAPGPALSGIRVLEVTTNWAGPAAGRYLADLGADVIKVEWATRPATRVLFWAGPGGQDQQRQGHNRSLYFNEINRNKRDVSVDLSVPEGREVFLDLVRTADVVIENNSARVMPKLGLAWEDLRQVNPGLIMVSMSGYGATGPKRDWVAYGANIEATSGLNSVTGYGDGALFRTGLFYADPVSGIHGSVAIMAALEHRRRTGEGQFVDISLNECGAAFCAEALLVHQATGVAPGPNGNRDQRFAPQGVYACVGVDHWLAVSCQSDEAWRELAQLIDRPDLAEDPELATLAGRQSRHDELDVALLIWASEREQYEAAWALQRVGVSAAPVLANWQVEADPHLFARGVFERVAHPVVGVYPTTTGPWRFERTPARIARPAPLFAEHNREVLAEAGLAESRIAELYASGVTADDPVIAG